MHFVKGFLKVFLVKIIYFTFLPYQQIFLLLIITVYFAKTLWVVVDANQYCLVSAKD